MKNLSGKWTESAESTYNLLGGPKIHLLAGLAGGVLYDVIREHFQSFYGTKALPITNTLTMALLSSGT